MQAMFYIKMFGYVAALRGPNNYQSFSERNGGMKVINLGFGWRATFRKIKT